MLIDKMSKTNSAEAFLHLHLYNNLHFKLYGATKATLTLYRLLCMLFCYLRYGLFIQNHWTYPESTVANRSRHGTVMNFL